MRREAVHHTAKAILKSIAKILKWIAILIAFGFGMFALFAVVSCQIEVEKGLNSTRDPPRGGQILVH